MTDPTPPKVQEPFTPWWIPPFRVVETDGGGIIRDSAGTHCGPQMPRMQAQWLCDRLNTPAPASHGEPWINAMLVDIAELPDRTSPDDYPDMLLITPDELEAMLYKHMPQSRATLPGSVTATPLQIQQLCEIAHQAFHVLDDSDVDAIREAALAHHVDALQAALIALTGGEDDDPHELLFAIRDATLPGTQDARAAAEEIGDIIMDTLRADLGAANAPTDRSRLYREIAAIITKHHTPSGPAALTEAIVFCSLHRLATCFQSEGGMICQRLPCVCARDVAEDLSREHGCSSCGKSHGGGLCPDI